MFKAPPPVGSETWKKSSAWEPAGRYRPIESPVLMLLGTDTSDSLKNATAALNPS